VGKRLFVPSPLYFYIGITIVAGGYWHAGVGWNSKTYRLFRNRILTNWQNIPIYISRPQRRRRSSCVGGTDA